LICPPIIGSAFSLKFEGPGGQAIERRSNIGVTNAWIEYEFDFSAGADLDSLNRILVFFDPGEGESTDEYQFDNIIARPAGPCAGVEEEPGVVDDFECQRNVTVGSPGFLDLTTIENPDMSGINTSDSVGRYDDTGGGAFHALVYSYEDDIPLDERNQVNIKVWAPKTGRLLVKLEGGNSAAVEKDAQVMETETWVEYTIDFSDQAGASHRDLVFFFNAGEQPEEGDIYFIDNITLTEAPTGDALETFEGGAQLNWTATGADAAVFGTFDGAIPNPDMDGNSSATVGSYTKGSSPLGGVEAGLPLDCSLENFPQVWAPTVTDEVTMRLLSPSAGIQEISAAVPDNETWVDLSFNFESSQNITDFDGIELLFDREVASSGTWYFDNLTQGGSTVDPCEGVEVDPQVVDDFDCQRNIPIVVGGDRIEVINNPGTDSEINTDPQDLVAEYTDPDDQFSAIVWDFGEPINLDVFNQLVVRIWSPEIVPLLFKIQGGSNDVEISTEVTAAGEWQEYVIDFSDQVGTDATQLAIFLNAGVAAGEEVIYYLDDIEFRRRAFDGCITDFETFGFDIRTWTYFDNGSIEDFEVIQNPAPSEVNMSDSVGVFRESADGVQPFAGAFAPLDAEVVFPEGSNMLATMKFWAEEAVPVVLKVEGSGNGSPGSGDVFADYTTPGEWQELTFDFSGTPLVDTGDYRVVTIIPNIENIPTENKIYYFDEIAIGEAQCGDATSVFQTPEVEQLQIAPNPVGAQLTIEHLDGVRQLILFNTLGQPVRRMQVQGPQRINMNTADLDKGMYILSAYDASGQVIGNARVIKN